MAEGEPQGSTIKLTYSYTNEYGQVFGSHETHDLNELAEPSSPSATKCDGSVETPYGEFMFDCKIAEARKVIESIREFIKLKDKLKNLENDLNTSGRKLEAARDRFQSGGDADHETSMQVMNLKDQKIKLQAHLKIYEERLAAFKI